MKCEYHITCGFIEDSKGMDPFTVSEVEATYCNSDKQDCVRYSLYQVLDPEIVPDFLWPNDEMSAMDLSIDRICKES